MKVFRVVTERDGATTKEPGRTTTEIERQEYRYATESIKQAWDHAYALAMQTDEEIVAIHEEHPAITILREISNNDTDY